MAKVSNSDLEAMFSDWDASTYTPNGYTHTSSKSKSVNGILQNEYVEVQGVESSSPVFTCSTASVSDATQGAQITIDDVVYTVRGVQPDGTGITRLILEEQ